MAESARFHWADYIVLAISLIISSSIGVFYGWKDRKKTNVEEYLMGGRKMNFLPVCASLFVSWISAISFLGDPVEVYYFGAMYWIMVLGYSVAPILVGAVFTPYYYKLKLTSAYQFLGERYTYRLRPVMSVIDGFGMMCFMGLALYAPCVALSQVSGIDVWVAIVVGGGVCVFYTSLGGIKAVLWADTLQMVIMALGVVVTLVVGTMDVGGVAKVWSIAEEKGRINFDNFSPNPLVRSSFWACLIGGFFRVFNPFASGQLFIQRISSTKNVTQAKMAVFGTSLLFALFGTLFLLTGLLMVAYFEDCDPVLSGQVSKPDQLMPFLIMRVLGPYPGLPGLFMACIISAALSSLSSGQSAMSTMCFSDIIMPLHHRCYGKPMTPTTAKWLARTLSVILGIVNVAVALLLIQFSNTTIFELSFKIIGILLGPSTGIFLVGVLLPFINTASACFGAVCCLVLNLWLGLGSLIYGTPSPILPINTDGCVAPNSSILFNSTLNIIAWNTTETAPTPTNSFNIYNFSTILYPILGPLFTFVFSLLAFPFTKLFYGRKSDQGEYSSVKAPEELNNLGD